MSHWQEFRSALPANFLGATVVVCLVAALGTLFASGLTLVGWRIVRHHVRNSLAAKKRLNRWSLAMTDAGVIRIYSTDRTLLAELTIERSGIKFLASGKTLASGRTSRAEWRLPDGDRITPPVDWLPPVLVVGTDVAYSFEAWGEVVAKLAECDRLSII